MGTQTLSLNWSNHKSNMSNVFQQLFSAKAFVDVTIVCDGLSLKAHKMVLSASSPLFRRLLLENPCQHPIVIMTDITYADMEALLSFMYRGEIDVTQEKLSQFLRTAEKLKIKGLTSSDSNISIYKHYNSSDEQIMAHPSEECLITTIAKPNATNSIDLERDVSIMKSDTCLEMDLKRTSAMKLEDSFEKCECIESEQNSNNEQCWKNISFNHPVSFSKPCATELAKSTISCLHHWEGLTNGKSSYVENQINNNNLNMQQEVATISENLPLVSDDNADLQESIFPPSVMQQTIGRRPLENIYLSKAEQVETGHFIYENGDDCGIPCENVDSEISQIKNQTLDCEEALLLNSHQTENAAFKLENNTTEQEMTEYNPHLVCHICNQSFVDLVRLSHHRRSHNHAQGPFTCSICNKVFDTRSKYQRHLKIHSGKRPYSCSTCNKTFRRSVHLKVHMCIHSGEKPFSCVICEKKFITKSHLKIHSRLHTGEKPFGCDFCNKRFIQKSDLIRHLVIHTGEKPYNCLICGKEFSYSKQLKVHALKIHSTQC